MSDKLHIALVGCGTMARAFHLPAIKLLKDELELVAVCDTMAERADEVAGIYECRAYGHLDEMLEKEKDLDVVAVTVQAQHHHTVAIRAAQAGKHVIVEKPIAITLSCADAMIEACEKHNVKLEVMENYLRMPMDAIVNKIARSDLLGGVRAVQVVDAVNGGSIDIAVHRYSQLREAAGGVPISIAAYASKVTLSPERERSEWATERHVGDWRSDWFVSMLEFENGVVGKCEFFPLHREAPVWPGDLRKIVGEEGIVVDDLWPNVWPRKPRGQITLKVSNSDDQVEVPIRRIEEDMGGHTFVIRVEVGSDPPITWENPVADVFRGSDLSCINRLKPTEWVVAEVTGYRDFARSLRQGVAPEYGWENGRNDLELTLAMYESARLGRKLALPLREVTEHEKQTHEMFFSRYGRPIL